jgi:glutamate-1-semialdehyde 2,1-aminomutase
MSGLGAFLATMQMMQRERVVEHLWSYGRSLQELINYKAKEYGLAHSIKAGGPSCSPWYSTFDSQGKVSLPLRTLFSQEMIRNGVLMPWIALCWRHGEQELRMTAEALDRALPIYCRALEEGVEKYLLGPSIKPVFRKFN